MEGQSLERSVGGTPEDGEASLVSPIWVLAVAAVPAEQVPQITRAWLQAVAEEAEDEDDVATESPAAVAAVSSLVALCQEALTRGTSVVFACYL